MRNISRSDRSRYWLMGGAMCAILMLSACSASQSSSPPTPGPPPAYQIGAGDTLDIIVWHEDKLSGPVQVRPDGKITVPLIGDVPCAGLTPEALAENIRSGLTRFVDSPNVVVRVAATGSRRFFIIGNVRSPGAYDLRADQTLLQALAVAGGFTEFADRGSLRIIRQNGANPLPATLDYGAIVNGSAPDVRLEPNDTIVVP